MKRGIITKLVSMEWEGKEDKKRVEEHFKLIASADKTKVDNVGYEIGGSFRL